MIMDDTTMINAWFSRKYRAAKSMMVMSLRWLYIILSIMLRNTPDLMLYLIYITKIVWKMRHSRKEEPEFAKKLVTSDLPNHGTTSLDVMTAKAELFGFLAVKIIPAQTNVQIIVTKGDGIVVCLQKGCVSFMQSKEADTHMFVHKKHASLTGSQTLMIVISYTDFVVLDIAGMLIWISMLCR